MTEQQKEFLTEHPLHFLYGFILRSKNLLGYNSKHRVSVFVEAIIIEKMILVLAEDVKEDNFLEFKEQKRFKDVVLFRQDISMLHDTLNIIACSILRHPKYSDIKLKNVLIKEMEDGIAKQNTAHE